MAFFGASIWTFFGDSLIINVFAFIGCILFTVYALCAYLQSRWSRKGIPYANALPVVGNIKNVIFGNKTIMDVLRDFYLEHRNKPFIGFFFLTHPIVMINDMELVKSILVKDFSSFTDRNFTASSADPLLHHNMFATKGQTWKHLRNKLAPTFTSGKLKKMFEFMDDCGKSLVVCLEKEIGASGEVEMKEIFARFTTDIIATCAFGIDGKALEDPESIFRQYMRKTVVPDFWQSLVGTLIFLFPSLVERLKLVNTKADVADFFRKTVWDTVGYREKNKVTRNDFLGLMMELKKMGSLKDDEPLEEGEVLEQSTAAVDLEGDKFVSQCFFFLIAGFETSSTTMSFAMYEMALNTDIQNTVYEEIVSVLDRHGGKVTYDAVQQMEYLHKVVQETLRKYPVLPFLDREATRPYRLPGTNIVLERGEPVMIPVIGLHYDPDLYPEPERFDPERFSEEQIRTRPACSFLGFGDGPRICIGMRMGWLQTKIGLIYTLLNYEITPSKATPIPIVFKKQAFPQVKGGIYLQIKKRNT